MRPKRFRCRCCYRLMAYEAYKRGDAIRRQPPQAHTCLDCVPEKLDGRRRKMPKPVSSEGTTRCQVRGCKPASAVDKLASVVRR